MSQESDHDAVIALTIGQEYIKTAVDELKRDFKNGMNDIKTDLSNRPCPSEHCVVCQDDIDYMKDVLGINGRDGETPLNVRVYNLEKNEEKQQTERQTLYKIAAGIFAGAVALSAFFSWVWDSLFK